MWWGDGSHCKHNESFNARILGQSIVECGFDHLDRQTLPHLSSICGDFSEEEFNRIIHETWRNFSTVFYRLFTSLTQKHYENSHEVH
jgi:hypothetical protein